MGLARFYDRGFDLTATFAFNATPEEKQAWERTFQHASQVLFEATHGQLCLRRVVLAHQSALHEADILILRDRRSGNSTASAVHDGMGQPGFPITLYQLHVEWPAVLVHELGHYAMDLVDEYSQPGRCTANPQIDQACLMAYGQDWTRRLPRDGREPHEEGRVRYFCGPDNHLQARRPRQTLDPCDPRPLADKSCWDRLEERFVHIETPANPSAPYGLKPDRVVIQTSGDKQLFSVAVDLSPDEVSYNIFRGVREGFELLRRGIRAADVDYQLIVNGESNTTFRGRWKAIWDHPAKNPGVIRSLQKALKGIEEHDEQDSATRAVFLVSDGTLDSDCQSDDEELAETLDQLIQKLIQHRVRVFAIAIEQPDENSNLRHICRETGGRYERLINDRTKLDVVRNVQEVVTFVVADVFANYGTIAVKRFKPSDANKEAQIEFLVEQGCEELVAVVVADAHPGHYLELHDPNGNKVDKSEIRYRRRRTYITASVDPRAREGLWRATVRPLTHSYRQPWHRKTGFTVVAFSRNASIHAAIRAETPFVTVGKRACIPTILKDSEPTKSVGPQDSSKLTVEISSDLDTHSGTREATDGGLLKTTGEHELYLDGLVHFKGPTCPLTDIGTTRIFVRISRNHYNSEGRLKGYQRVLQYQIEVVAPKIADGECPSQEDCHEQA